MKRHAALAASAVALAILAGCTKDPEPTAVRATGTTATASASGPASSTPSAPTTSADLPASTAAALALVPSAASNFTISDPAAAKARWGYSNVNSSTDQGSQEFKEYVRKTLRSAAISRMMNYAIRMAEEWGWGGFDVDWEIQVITGGAPLAVYKMRDDLDMGVVTSSLDKYFTRSGPDDRPVYKADLKKSGMVPFFDATVIPDKHLIVAGPAAEAVLKLVDGSGSAVWADPAVVDLVVQAGPADLLIVRTGVDSCTDPISALGPSITPEAINKVKELFADIHIARPTAVVLALTDDENAVVVAEYADAATASAEVGARRKLLTDGTSLGSRQPYSELLTVRSIEATDRVLRYELTSKKAGSPLFNSMTQRRDDPWAFCPTL